MSDAPCEEILYKPHSAYAGASESARGEQIGCLRILSVADAKVAQPGRHLVKGLFYEDQLGVVFGEPGCGKSFLLSHIAYAISQGRSVFDLKVVQKGVLYLSLEGGTGFEQRIKGLSVEFDDSDSFRYVARPVVFLAEDVAAQSVIEAAQKLDAKLIVIDTVARAMGAADENSSHDMGKLIAVMDEIRAATRACVVLVHHTPKSDQRTPRGHSSLMGAADLMIAVEQAEGGHRQATVVKAKDSQAGRTLGFTLRQIELGTDSDGDPVTTCIVAATDGTPRTRVIKLTTDERGYLTDLNNYFSDQFVGAMVRPYPDMQPVRAATREEVRDALRKAGRFDTPAGDALSAADRQKFGRILNKLKNRGAVCMTEKYVWLP